MLKTTMLVAGLAAATALDKKECSGTTTLKNDDLGSAFVCTAAKTHNAFCTYTAKTTPTHFGGGIMCVEDTLGGAAAGTGCFEYMVSKSCPLLTKAGVEAWGCTQAAAITATDISVDATSKAASYTCNIADTHAKYTESNGVKTYTADTTVTVNCDHSKGTWTPPKLSTEGVCSAPVLDAAALAKYRLADNTNNEIDITTATTANRDTKGEVKDFKLWSDGNPTGAKVCGVAAGTAITTNFPKVVKGQYCATRSKRDGVADGYFGAFQCDGGANWKLPTKMCKMPARCRLTDDSGICAATGGTAGEDTYFANKLIALAGTQTAAAVSSTVFCTADFATATAQTGDIFAIPGLYVDGQDADNSDPLKGYIPQTSDSYRCFFNTATIGGTDYGYAEVKCGATAAELTKTTLPTAKEICATGELDTSPTASIELKFTGVGVDTNSYKTGSKTTTIRERTQGGATFKITDMGTGNTAVQDGTGDMVSATRHITLGGCQCGAGGVYECSKTETGCIAATAALTTTLAGRAVKCTAGEQPASYLDQTRACAASGTTVASTVKCSGGKFVAATGGGTQCAANATATAQVAATQTSRGFSWNCAVMSLTGQCSSNIVPTDGRTTCAKARWAPGYLTCSLVDGKWSIQDDYSKCEGSSGYELSDAVRNAHNFKSYSIAALPGSVATVVCKDGFGTLKVKDAAAADTMIQKGSGKCSNDNKGVTKFVPCLKSCNTSNVANDLNGTAKGTIDVAGTDCAGLKVWNNNSDDTYQYNCNTKSADKYNGGRIYCDGKTGKFAVGEQGTLKKCSITAGLEKGQVGALCAAGGATEKGTSYLDVACTALGLVAVDGKEVDKESAAYKIAYDCTGVTADGAKCTVSANETNFDVSATCCTTNACLDDAKCYQPGKDTRDRTEGCWNFKVDPKESGASMIGAGIVTLLALFHL